MLKLVSSMSELNTEQYLAVYRGSNRDFEAEDRMLTYLREDFFTTRGAVCALWMVDGLYKSALRLEPHRDGYLISALETAPDVRRKGYAKCLLQAVTSQYSAPFYSHIAKNNKPSRNLHIACGFDLSSDSAVLLDGTVTQNYCTMIYCK